MRSRNVARLYSRVSWRETDEQQVKCWVSFVGRSHVFSRASSRSTCVFHFLFSARLFTITPFVNNISNVLLQSSLSFSSSLSRRWPKCRPSPDTNFWLTQTTHNLAWMVLPGARHAGKGLHHRVRSVCLRESVCVRWKSSLRSSVKCQKPVDWISGWAGSVETPSLPERTTQRY